MNKPSINQALKTLTAPELHNLQELVREIFTLMDSDVDGLLIDIYEPALVAAEILGIPGSEIESITDKY